MSIKIKRGFIYLVDLNPKIGIELGKVRPVLVLQTNLLNNEHYREWSKWDNLEKVIKNTKSVNAIDIIVRKDKEELKKEVL